MKIVWSQYKKAHTIMLSMSVCLEVEPATYVLPLSDRFNSNVFPSKVELCITFSASLACSFLTNRTKP